MRTAKTPKRVWLLDKWRGQSSVLESNLSGNRAAGTSALTPATRDELQEGSITYAIFERPRLMLDSRLPSGAAFGEKSCPCFKSSITFFLKAASSIDAERLDSYRLPQLASF